MENGPQSNWILTDPDCLQCCRLTPEFGPRVYELVQINSFGPEITGSEFFQVASGHIYLDDYTKDEELAELACYGYDVVDRGNEGHFEMSDEDFDHILAEMYFESESLECCAHECATWNQAVDYVQKLTGMDLSVYKGKDKSLDEQMNGNLEAVPHSRLDELISSAQSRAQVFGSSNSPRQDKSR